MREKYHSRTVYVVGHGKTSVDNAITTNFKIFFIGFVIDTETNCVVDLEASTTLSITNEFIKSIFLEKRFDSYDCEIEAELLKRYFGTSQKAIITAYKDALKKYKGIIETHY